MGGVVRLGSTVLLVREGDRRPNERRLSAMSAFDENIRRRCATAEPFSLVRLRLSRALPDWVLERVLSRLPQAHDLVASPAPGEYELLVPDSSRALVADLVRSFVAELEPLGLDIQAALASHPSDGRTPEALRTRLTLATTIEADAPADDAPVVGAPAMVALYALVDRIASSSINVLLCGETGAGKEVVAEALCAASPRRNKTFVRLNCAALSATLLESELFGYERGAFTGADRQKIGLLEAAQGGTVLLDEIGEMALETQARLLRAIERREITRVGGVKTIPIDVRFISATNRRLEREVAKGRFREDLFFRLNGIKLDVPPLRERREEIRPLARRFVRAMAAELRRTAPELSPEALAVLERYAWPGNVRELKNVVHRALLLSSGPRIEAGDLALEEQAHALDDAAETQRELQPIAAPSAEGDSATPPRAAVVIRSALAETGGNQTRAARLLGVSRQTLGKWMKLHGIPRPLASNA